MSSTQDGLALSGYTNEDSFLATRKRMGGRWVVHFDQSIAQLVLAVDAPPVNVPQEDNRTVSGARASAFADYVDKRPKWATPSIVLWVPEGIVRFDSSYDVIRQINDLVPDHSVEIGILYVPRNSRLSIRILDGQHRVVGFHRWIEKLNDERRKAADHLARAHENGDQALIKDAQVRLRRADEALARPAREAIGIDLVECNTAKEARQIFADIANHAKGMNKSVTTRFDTSKIANRVTQSLIFDDPHPLLDKRVDEQKDRVAGTNPNLMSAKTVSDIVRAVSVGVVGRFRKTEEAMDDSEVEAPVREFLDALQDSFPALTELAPPVLRETSLLGSGTVLRVLAGVWHNLTTTTDAAGNRVDPLMSPEEIKQFFKDLNEHMEAPVRKGNPWLQTGAFPVPPAGAGQEEALAKGFMAPSSRNQDLKLLASQVTSWAIDPEKSPF